MKATFEIDFADEKQAKLALKALESVTAGVSAGWRPGVPNKRAVMHVSHKAGTRILIYTMTADSFSSLRARATSLLRDLKVAREAFELAGR